jgi:hypothetical protein
MVCAATTALFHTASKAPSLSSHLAETVKFLSDLDNHDPPGGHENMKQGIAPKR